MKVIRRPSEYANTLIKYGKSFTPYDRMKLMTYEGVNG